MWEILRDWQRRYLSNEEVLILVLLTVLGLVLILTAIDLLAPVITSLVLALLMQGLLNILRRWGIPNLLAQSLTLALFLGIFLSLMLIVLPLVWRQLSNMAADLPQMLQRAQEMLQMLIERYPWLAEFIVVERIWENLGINNDDIGQWIVSFSLTGIANIVSLFIYLILVPIMAFFMLRDGDRLLAYLASYLPEKRPLMRGIWKEVNEKMASYVRGKALEILIIGGTSFALFFLGGLRYAALLGLLVGLSVIIPYVGALLVTFVVAAVALAQWGLSAPSLYIFALYMVIQVFDGNLLVPLLFSDRVDLHPLSILIAILIFGGLWGVWGVFFAIPLAVLLKSVVHAGLLVPKLTAQAAEKQPK